MSDKINHPSHYTNNKIETIDIIKDSLTAEEYRGYVKGNILKYVIRERYKNGDEDLGKARWYLSNLLGIVNTAEKITQSSSEHIDSCGMAAKSQGKHVCNCEMKSNVNMIGTKKQLKKRMEEQEEIRKFFEQGLTMHQQLEKSSIRANQKYPKAVLGILLTVIIVLLV
jgi:hypothetical protein